ncbi:cell division protein [Bifidobacterium animalis]|uniref:cell division protein n=1 Tax=Bifidobacterium animalis TaxID=28025 RepID=UPI003F91B116
MTQNDSSTQTIHDGGNDAPQPPQESSARRPAFNMDDLPDLRDNAPDPDALRKAEFTTVYDIIDSLEEMITSAKGSMFSPSSVKIDRDDFLDKLEDLKTKLPVQLERASALMREAEGRLANANSQANVIISTAQARAANIIRDANERADYLASQEKVTEIARQKAKTMIDKAQAASDRLTSGADQYCIKIMNELHSQLGKMTRDVEGGLNVLEEREAKAREELPHAEESDYPQD